MKRILIAAAALVLGAAALPAQASDIDFQIVIGNAPPPPRYEVVPAPRAKRIWVPGHWAWTGRRHVWIDGHWVRARSGYAYRQPQWRRGPHGWRYERGGWHRHHAHPRKWEHVREHRHERRDGDRRHRHDR